MKVNSTNLNNNTPSFGQVVVRKMGNKTQLYITTVNPLKDSFVSFFNKDTSTWKNFHNSSLASKLTKKLRNYSKGSTSTIINDVKKGASYIFENIIKPNSERVGLEKNAILDLENAIKAGKLSYSIKNKEGILGFGFDNL